jgi:hypothetical protein
LIVSEHSAISLLIFSTKGKSNSGEFATYFSGFPGITLTSFFTSKLLNAP